MSTKEGPSLPPAQPALLSRTQPMGRQHYLLEAHFYANAFGGLFRETMAPRRLSCSGRQAEVCLRTKGNGNWEPEGWGGGDGKEEEWHWQDWVLEEQEQGSPPPILIEAGWTDPERGKSGLPSPV